MNNQLPSKIYSLDVLRGVAALSVVFWHWQHFFYVDNKLQNFKIDSQPFFNVFDLLYRYGGHAIELFFCISGFIFYWLYSQNIFNRKIKVKEFIVNRFSRLYPLYIITFLSVYILQSVYIKLHAGGGGYFVYKFNVLYHAILNILMASAWGFELGWSFNAPVWSVSIEILLYSIFFIVCLFGRARFILIPIFILSGYYIFSVNSKIGIGLFSFFCGAATYIITIFSIKIIKSKSTIILSVISIITSWGIIYHYNIGSQFIITAFGFTSLILFFASLSLKWNWMFYKIRWIGDISYSSYLIHFPLQMIFAMIADKLGFSREVFYTPLSIILFIVILITLSLASHKLFELPSQRYIRKHFIVKKSLI